MFPFLALFLPQNSPSCANFIQWFEMGAIAGREMAFPSYPALPHQRKKKGLMIAVSLTFLFRLIEVLRGKSRNF